MLVSTFFSLALFAVQAGAVPPLEQVCRHYVPDELSQPGLSIAVVDNGAVEFASCGLADVETGRLIDETTPFHLSSLTKQFVAWDVIQLAREGRLSLSAPISRYLPEFSARPALTVGDLLAHTSGLYEYWFQWRMSDAPADSMQDVIALIASQEYRNFEPGEEFSYTNTNYVVLAHLLERLTGTPLHQRLRTRIFQPLELTQTGFPVSPDTPMDARARGYTQGDNGPERINYTFSDILGDGGLYASAEDLVRWISEFDGSQPGLTLADRIAMSETEEETRFNYAAGLHIRSWNGRRLYTHGGANRGASSYMAYQPELGLAVIVLANTDQINAQGVASDILQRYLGGGREDGAQVPEGVPPERAAGIFVGDINGEMTVLELSTIAAGVELGRPGATPHLYNCDDRYVCARSDALFIQIVARDAERLEFWVNGEFYTGLDRLDASEIEEPELGCWTAEEWSGSNWCITRTEGGFELTSARGTREHLQQLVPGVWAAPSSGFALNWTGDTYRLFAPQVRGLLLSPV